MGKVLIKKTNKELKCLICDSNSFGVNEVTVQEIEYHVGDHDRNFMACKCYECGYVVLFNDYSDIEVKIEI